MQISETTLASVPSSSKVNEAGAVPTKSEHHHGFCGVFERLAEREDSAKNTTEPDPDLTVDVDIVDQGLVDADSVDRPDFGVEGDEVTSKTKDVFDDQSVEILLPGSQSKRDTLTGRFDQAPAKVVNPDAGFYPTQEVEPPRENGSNPVLGESKSDDRSGVQSDAKIDHFGPRHPSSIEAAMVGRMRFEGVVEAGFEMPPSTIAQQVTHLKTTASVGDSPQVRPDQTAVANGRNDATAQERANVETPIRSEPAPKFNELGADTRLAKQSIVNESNGDAPELAPLKSKVTRPDSGHFDIQSSRQSTPIENEVRVAPQQVAQMSSSIVQPSAPDTRDPLRGTSKGDDTAKINLELGLEIRQDVRNVGSSSVLTQTARPEVSQTMIRQMTDAVRTQMTSEKTVEISLRPAELGRVRIALSPAETGMIVTISAERGETLEVMRRNIDELARSFAEMGHESLTFNFEQNGAFDQKDDRPTSAGLVDESAINDAATKTETQTQPPVLQMQNTGVDILV